MQDFFAWIHVRVPIFCGMVCVSQVSQDTQTRGTQLLVIRCILTCMFLCMFCTVDECITDNGGCEHICEDTSLSFTCSCTDGFL